MSLIRAASALPAFAALFPESAISFHSVTLLLCERMWKLSASMTVCLATRQYAELLSELAKGLEPSTPCLQEPICRGATSPDLQEHQPPGTVPGSCRLRAIRVGADVRLWHGDSLAHRLRRRAAWSSTRSV